jgi:hypothetical protein
MRAMVSRLAGAVGAAEPEHHELDDVFTRTLEDRHAGMLPNPT